jgi:MarR family transcriptional regulator for hemolysin
VRVRHEVLQGIDEADLHAALRVLRAFEAAGLGSTGGVA